jgi:2-oxoglutarate dehydrogenase E2 component (dihydrolipoamide succinyltransferase)
VGSLIDLIAPLEDEGAKATVVAWFKAVGERVDADEPVLELETDKVVIEVAAPISGVLEELLLPKDAEAMAGTVLGRIRSGGSAEAPTTPRSTERSDPRPALEAGELRLSPSVRRLVAESGLDPSSVAGSGRGGRLTRHDLVQEIARRGQISLSQPTAAEPGAVRRIPHDRMRRQIAEHMSRSLATAPHVTAVFEADFSAVIAHRADHKGAFASKGVSLTYTAYIVSAATAAMAAAPNVNSRWHEDHLEVFADVNMGVGTALGEKGLIVPVIHAAQSLTLIQIAARLHDLTERARSGKLAAQDVQGGTFSISNHGVSGSLLAAPIIINQPQSAILGVGKLEKRVVAREVGGVDTIQIRPMAFVSLSIDHRVIDAVQTNAWLSRFVQVLETWPAE